MLFPNSFDGFCQQVLSEGGKKSWILMKINLAVTSQMG